MIHITLEGVEEVQRALQQFERRAIDELVAEMTKSKEDLLSKSQQLAPVLTGKLMESGTADPPVGMRVQPDEISAEVGYHVVYARRRHEEFYNPGPRTASKPQVDGMIPGRKYLEQPALRYAKDYLQAWTAAVRRAMS